jgi:hypothetical protein
MIQECCIFIKDLEKSETNCWSDNPDDSRIEQYLKKKVVSKEEIDERFDSLRKFVVGL